MNLEDIAHPGLEIERRLRTIESPSSTTPARTASVVRAALINALRVVDKKIGDVRL